MESLLSHGITDLDKTIVLYFSVVMIFSAIMLVFLPAPYGKFANSMDFLPILSIKLPWKLWFTLSESPALFMPLVATYLFWEDVTPSFFTFFFLYELHYIHRLIIYPHRRVRSNHGKSTLIIVFMSFAFQSVNGFMMTKFAIFQNKVSILSDNGLLTPGYAFYNGLAMFFLGAFFNLYCDECLIQLRQSGDDSKYYLPKGSELFDKIASPNYLAEIVEWMGMMLLYPNPATVGFVINTCANLVPRAIATNRFYKQRFGDRNPPGRKAIIPMVL